MVDEYIELFSIGILKAFDEKYSLYEKSTDDGVPDFISEDCSHWVEITEAVDSEEITVMSIFASSIMNHTKEDIPPYYRQYSEKSQLINGIYMVGPPTSHVVSGEIFQIALEKKIKKLEKQYPNKENCELMIYDRSGYFNETRENEVIEMIS